MQHSSRLLATVLTLSGLALAGCTTVISQGVDDEGKASEIIFPEIDKTSGIHGGVFPNVENLRKIGNGVSKDDLYHLIGRPHFSEGIAAREWDYVMKFREEVNGPITICQYKVIFDKDMKGQTFVWKPQDCENFLYGKKPAAAKPEILTLKGDTLFRFDGSSTEQMLPGGRAELNRLADELKSRGSDARMRVVGHTDRLGSDSYNLALSQRRAETVRNYLIGQGIPADNITATGMGESQPVVQCAETARSALVACLQPNRRVEVEVTTVR